MAPALDAEGAGIVHLRLGPVARAGEDGESQAQVELGQPQRQPRQRGRGVQNLRPQVREQAFLDLQRLAAGVEDARLDLGQLDGGEAQLVGGGLAMDEGVRQRRLQHPVAVCRRRLDEVAQHVVVLDLEARDAGLLRVIRLHARDHAASFVSQLPRLVQRGVVPRGDEAAVADQQWRVGHQCCGQRVAQGVEARQRLARLDQHVGQVGAVQQAQDVGGLLAGVAQRRQVARPAPVQRQPRQRAVEVRHPPQRVAQPVGQRRLDRPAHSLQPPTDDAQIARGRGQPPFQQPRAGGRHRAVDHRQQAAGPAALQAVRQLEVSARRGVDLHQARRRLGPRRGQAGQGALLRDVEIVDHRAHRRQLGPVEGAEARQRGHAVGGAQSPLGRGGIEAGRTQYRGPDAEVAQNLAHGLVDRVGHQQLGGRQARDLGADARLSDLHHVKRACRDVAPRQRPVVAHARQRRQVIVPARVQKRVLGQRAGRDEAHDLAPHDGLGAALLGLGRRLHLLAHGDAEPLADQRQKVTLGRVHRHAAHGDVVAVVLAALGQGDVQRLGRRGGVVEEQLVEVAHAIEQQRVGILGLDRQILRHHRCDGRVLRFDTGVHEPSPGRFGVTLRLTEER